MTAIGDFHVQQAVESAEAYPAVGMTVRAND